MRVSQNNYICHIANKMAIKSVHCNVIGMTVSVPIRGCDSICAIYKLMSS